MEVFGYAATFIGGNPDNTIYRYRWQYKVENGSQWTSSSWTSYNNLSVAELSYVIPIEAGGGSVRLQSQARDTTDPENVIQVNDYLSSESVAYPPLVVAETTVSGTLMLVRLLPVHNLL